MHDQQRHLNDGTASPSQHEANFQAAIQAAGKYMLTIARTYGASEGWPQGVGLLADIFSKIEPLLADWSPEQRAAWDRAVAAHAHM